MGNSLEMAIVILFVRHCAKILWRFNVSTSTMWHISHLSITLAPGGPVAFVPSMDSIRFVSLLKSSRFLMLMGTIIGHPTYFQVQKKKKNQEFASGGHRALQKVYEVHFEMPQPAPKLERCPVLIQAKLIIRPPPLRPCALRPLEPCVLPGAQT